LTHTVYTLPLSPPTKGGSETLLRCFTNKTDTLDKILLQSFSALKLSDKVLILPPVSHRDDDRVAQKCNLLI